MLTSDLRSRITTMHHHSQSRKSGSLLEMKAGVYCPTKRNRVRGGGERMTETVYSVSGVGRLSRTSGGTSLQIPTVAVTAHSPVSSA